MLLTLSPLQADLVQSKTMDGRVQCSCMLSVERVKYNDFIYTSCSFRQNIFSSFNHFNFKVAEGWRNAFKCIIHVLTCYWKLFSLLRYTNNSIQKIIMQFSNPLCLQIYIYTKTCPPMKFNSGPSNYFIVYLSTMQCNL